MSVRSEGPNGAQAGASGSWTTSLGNWETATRRSTRREELPGSACLPHSKKLLRAF